MTLRVLPAVLALCSPLLVVGCGDDGQESGSDLVVSRRDAKHPSAGAAGNAVECDTWGRGGTAWSGSKPYAEGATSSSPRKALATASGEGGFEGVQDDLTEARRDGDRVLFTVEVAGKVKQAVIVRDGPATKGAGGDGWYVETWARCDYAELPRSYTDSIGLQVWTDTKGDPVPTDELVAWVGPEHCDWESMTFLYVDGDDTDAYLRNPLPDVTSSLSGPYRAHAKLPADAVDTGHEREGEHLWLSADRSSAFVGTATDVEVWPRAADLGCA